MLSGKEVCTILTALETVRVRQKGSHVIMQKREGGTTITVPVPDHEELRQGTLRSIIRQSGLPRTLFETGS